jgi:hypothetical protein
MTPSLNLILALLEFDKVEVRLLVCIGCDVRRIITHSEVGLRLPSGDLLVSCTICLLDICMCVTNNVGGWLVISE